MRRGLLISSSVHLVLIIILIAPLSGRGSALSPGTVYDVSLVSLPVGSPGPPGPPAGSDEPPDATLATPEPEVAPKKEVPKLPEEKAPEKKKPEATEKESQKAAEKEKAAKKSSGSGEPELHSLVKGGTGTGTGGTGQGGFSSQLQIDIENFEFSYYLVAVRNKVSSNWSPPAGVVTSGGAVRTVVYFRILRSGKIADLAIEKPSSVGLFDQSALRAVLRAQPFPPLPRGFADGSLGVHFGFEYVK
ncbi:MAG: TonB family protein [Candidatus Eiseniibacteriota bacterium]|nr:MAG: TonB family protein [Candidatus Eisenbacteria bacterium]